jgi:hypothetical protein
MSCRAFSLVSRVSVIHRRAKQEKVGVSNGYNRIRKHLSVNIYVYVKHKDHLRYAYARHAIAIAALVLKRRDIQPSVTLHPSRSQGPSS